MRAPFRVVVITGASSGLGAALAGAYAGPGVALGLLGRNRERLDAVTRGCEARGSRVDTAAIDVTDMPAMTAWLQRFDRDYSVELLVANAGTSAGPERGSPGEGVELAARQVGVNLLGAINTIEPLLPAMSARGRGRVAVVASIAGYRGLPDSPGYSASKAGLRAYGEALRARLAPHGIGVSVVAPGFFASPMTDRFDGPTPFLYGAATAARIVKRGIDRGRNRVSFPWPLVFGLKFCDFAPAALGDAILRRFHFHIRPE
jgi:NAD(P)-dependent dehydrogenase (short-subunit alcohol dehydrogenase family)